MHSDIRHIHSPPRDKILWRSYQVAKLQETQAGTLKTSGDRCGDIAAAFPSVGYYETGKHAAWMSTDTNTQNNARFGVPVAVAVKNHIFCYVTPYSLADIDGRFGEHHCPHLWSNKNTT